MDYRYQLMPDRSLHFLCDGQTISVIPSDGEIGILYERFDDEDPMAILHKHGNAQTIRQRHAAMAGALHSAGLDDVALRLTTLVLPIPRLTPAIVEELNACIDISGRVGLFEQRIAAMRGSHA